MIVQVGYERSSPIICAIGDGSARIHYRSKIKAVGIIELRSHWRRPTFIYILYVFKKHQTSQFCVFVAYKHGTDYLNL